MWDTTFSFHDAFRFVCAGRAPFRWQRRLFDRLVQGYVPPSCSLPTGLGKTSIIPIWLIALAHSVLANNARPRPPRRLVYIVNRRTVVDQATDDAKRLLSYIYQSGTRDNLRWATDDNHVLGLGLAYRSQDAREDAAVRFYEPLADEHAPTVAVLRNALAALSGDDSAAPLAVSTLRGELADNGEWKVNPARPAIIVGTIDMIGSKLLLSGYGDGRYGRAHHAGLIGQDTLIVHDEAHLSPAFSRLLRAVEQEQGREFKRNEGLNDITRPIRVMELSATTRSDGGSGGGQALGVFGIEDADGADSVVQQRLTAKKRLSLVEVDAGRRNGLVGAIADAAHEHDGKTCRVLVYVRSPETAAMVVDELKKRLTANGGAVKRGRGRTDRSSDREGAGEVVGVAGAGPLPDGRGSDSRVGLLTGTIRGYERDQLAKSDLFKTFKSDPHRPRQLQQTVYLVSNSAGEVGADWDADHLVCDLTTLDSMIQRFGRVNRLGVDKDGKPREATISVVVEKPKESKKAAQPAESTPADTEGGEKDKKQNPLDAAIARTREILRRIADDGGDVSPAALAKVIDGLSAEDMRAAFSPAPAILPATDILFDAWSLTSIAGELPGRPEVAPYLHGVAEWEPPETYVAWRADVRLLAEAFGDGAAATKEIETVFKRFPIRSHERLRDTTRRVQESLKSLAKQDHRAPDDDNEESSEQAVRSTRAKERQKVVVGSVPVIVLNSRGELVTLKDEKGNPRLPTIDECADENRMRVRYCTIVLPVEAGGLKDGWLDPKEPAPADPTSLDVAEWAADGKMDRQRVFVGGSDGEEQTDTPILGGAPATGLVTRHMVRLRPETDEDEAPGRAIEYRVAPRESGEPGHAVTLRDHTSAVVAAAERIGRALALDDSIREALALAARWHDAGKARALWQRYARNGDAGAPPLAKAGKGRYLPPRALGGYRHEFGSLLEVGDHRPQAALTGTTAESEPRPSGSGSADGIGPLPHGRGSDQVSQTPSEIANHPERDLILHLIAAHHGWGRPHFEPRAFDRERPTSENEAAAVEVMQRFGRLQQRFGRWGLAWLESLLRCADALGSQLDQKATGGAGVPPGHSICQGTNDPSRDREGAVGTDAPHASAKETREGELA